MNNFQPAAQPQFQAPQYTAPYTPPTQQFSAQPGPQGQAAPQQPQAAQGSLGQGWDQGTRAGGHGGAAKFPDQGSIFEGFIARTMVDADCRQAREPSKDGNGPLKFFKKSGAPQFEYVIAVNVQASPDYPEGKATLFTSKYKLHSAVVRAMQEAGYSAGEPLREGDYIWVQRIGDVQSGYGQPGHDFVAKVTRRENIGGQQGAAPAQANPTPTAGSVSSAAQAPTEYSAPVQQAANPTVATSAPAPSTVNQVAGPGATPTEAPAIPGLSPEMAAIVAQYAPGFAQQQG